MSVKRLSGIWGILLYTGLIGMFASQQLVNNLSLGVDMSQWSPMMATIVHLLDGLYTSFTMYFYLPLIAVILLTEAALAGWEESTLASLVSTRAQSAWEDVGIFILAQLGAFAVLSLVFSLGLLPAIEWGMGQVSPPLTPYLKLTTGVLIADLAIYHLVASFINYWWHRLSHREPLWFVHRIHHSGTTLSAFTASREHPAVEIFSALTRGVCMLLIGLPIGVVTAFSLWFLLHLFVVHTRLKWDFGWIGRWIIVSPAGHHVHHSTHPEHLDKNFSFCPLWDHVFGTWYAGDTPAVEFGVPDNPRRGQSVFVQWVVDSFALFKSVGRLFAAKTGR